MNFLGYPNIIATAVLHGPGGVALIDPGPSTSLSHLQEALERGGLRMHDVRQILLRGPERYPAVPRPRKADAPSQAAAHARPVASSALGTRVGVPAGPADGVGEEDGVEHRRARPGRC